MEEKQNPAYLGFDFLNYVNFISLYDFQNLQCMKLKSCDSDFVLQSARKLH